METPRCKQSFLRMIVKMSNGDGKRDSWSEEETVILTFIVQKVHSEKNLILQSAMCNMRQC